MIPPYIAVINTRLHFIVIYPLKLSDFEPVGGNLQMLKPATCIQTCYVNSIEHCLNNYYN